MTGMLSTITDEVKHCFCGKTDGNANAFQILPDSVREECAKGLPRCKQAHGSAVELYAVGKHKPCSEKMAPEDGGWKEREPQKSGMPRVICTESFGNIFARS